MHIRMIYPAHTIRGRMVLLALLALAGCGGGKSGPRPEAPVAVLMPAPPPEPGPDYRINADDELHVRFLYHPDMTEQLPVRPDGRISLGATGELVAVGLTPAELERLIVERSAERLRNPVVTVIVTKLSEQRVYVG